jgi:hypothetical protein
MLLTAAVLLGACAGEGSSTDNTNDTASTSPAAEIATGSDSTSTTVAPPTTPAPDPAYSPPDDWHDRALATADEARRSVVAIGWKPPGMLRRRLETGWLLAPDLVVTSHTVACEARNGSNLRVRTFSGRLLSAEIDTEVGACDGWQPGIAVLRLAAEVDDPTLRLRAQGNPEIGEPLLAIGHANHAPNLGGWLVAVGPMVEVNGDAMLVDIGMSVTLSRIGEFFGGGSNGAPVIDLDGQVVAVLCCEREWGPALRYDDTISEPLLRSRLVLDGRYHVAGLSGDALRAALG